MDPSTPPPSPRPTWHALLAPLPDGAVPRREPVAPPEVLATPEGASIAGWRRVVLELRAGTAGLRLVLVVLDETGRAISASDSSTHRRELAAADSPDGEPVVAFRNENLGGRFEPDGRFLGTRWLSTSLEDADGTARDVVHTPAEPTLAEVARLRALVDEVLRRLPAGEGREGPPSR